MPSIPADIPSTAVDDTVEAILDRTWSAPRIDRGALLRALPDGDLGDGRLNAIRCVVGAKTVVPLDAAIVVPRLHDAVRELAGDPRWLLRASTVLGHWYLLSAQFREALDLLSRCIDEFLEGGDGEDLATASIYAGESAMRLGDQSTASDYFIRAEELSARAGRPLGIAAAVNAQANVYMHLGDFAAALASYRRALEIVEREGDGIDGNAIIALSGIAACHGELGDYSTALEYDERVHALNLEAGHELEIANSCHNVGVDLQNLGRLDEALAMLEQALALFDRTADHLGSSLARGSIAEIHLKQGRLDIARPLLESALADATRLGTRPDAAWLHELLATLHERQENHREANEHLRASTRLGEEIRSDEARKRLDSMDASRKIALAEAEAAMEHLRNVELAAALEQLKQAQAQLVHAEKMASIGQLTAGIAHEINNPVNFIMTAIAPLERDIVALDELDAGSDERAEVREEIASLLRGIREGAARTAEIVRSLRTFSRLDEDERKPVDLIEGIESTITLVRSRLASIEIVRRFEELPPVDCYPGQINQVVMNVLANAIDACGAEGTVTIATACDGDDVVVAIADTGSGIAPENLPRIFEPFFTTKPVGAGQGLGLAIAHAIIEKHQGSIAVESEPELGTTVTVRLPHRATHSSNPL